jgi:uncharacterized lipoprotein YbaY
MKRTSAAAIIAASALFAAASAAQTPAPAPASAATGAQPEPTSAASSATRGKAHADARVCLEFPTNAQIIQCAEKYRHMKPK